MRGLLVKDFRLLMHQKQFFLMVAVLMAVFALEGQDAVFIVSFCTIVIAFFTISTISYDEFNNGYAFLFTMPVSRRGYAAEKYLFVLLTGGSAWLVTTCAGALYGLAGESGADAAEWLMSTLYVFPILGYLMAVLLPLQMKFGAEKSRIATIICAFALSAVLVLLLKAEKAFGISEWIRDGVFSMGTAGSFLLAAAAFVAVIGLSLALSIRIMEKKQF